MNIKVIDQFHQPDIKPIGSSDTNVFMMGQLLVLGIYFQKSVGTLISRTFPMS